VHLDLLDLLDLRVKLDCLEQLDSKDLPDSQGRVVAKVRPVIRGRRERSEHPAYLAVRASPVRLEQLAIPDRKGQSVLPAPSVNRVRSDSPERRGMLADAELTETPDTPERRDRREREACRVLAETPVRRELLERLDLRV